MIRAVLGSLLLLAPGVAWSTVLFPHAKFPERLMLALAFSITLTTLAIIVFNSLLGMRITGFNSALVLAILTIVPVAVYFLNLYLRRSRARPKVSEGDKDCSMLP